MDFATPRKVDLSALFENTIVLPKFRSRRMFTRIFDTTLAFISASDKTNPGEIHFKFEKKIL